MDNRGFYMHGGGPGFFGWFLFLLLLALLVGLIVVVMTRLSSSRAATHASIGSRTGEDALELLRLRYARGEIDRETFLQTNTDLGGPAPPA